MNKILKLIIDDYQNHKLSAEYKFALHRYCDAERKFMDTLNKNQKAEFLKLDFIAGELNVAEQNDFAEFLFSYLIKSL